GVEALRVRIALIARILVVCAHPDQAVGDDRAAEVGRTELRGPLHVSSVADGTRLRVLGREPPIRWRAFFGTHRVVRGIASEHRPIVRMARSDKRDSNGPGKDGASHYSPSGLMQCSTAAPLERGNAGFLDQTAGPPDAVVIIRLVWFPWRSQPRSG